MRVFSRGGGFAETSIVQTAAPRLDDVYYYYYHYKYY